MIGIFYTLGILIGGAISGAKCELENIESKQNGINRSNNGINPAKTYYDRKGIQRLISTNEIASTGPDPHEMNDDIYLWVGTPSKRSTNLSAQQREIDFEKGKNGNHHGQTVDLYDTRFWSISGSNQYKNYCRGAYYKDLNNGKMYVCREFPLRYNDDTKRYELDKGCDQTKPFHTKIKCAFYMDIKTGFLVRKTDTQIKWEKEHNIVEMSDEDTKEFIEHFNFMQRKDRWYEGKIGGFVEKDIEEKQLYYCDDFNAYDYLNKLVSIN